jgi:hypothetical protein
MAEVPEISIVNGIPTAGTGEVKTLSFFDRGAGTGGTATLRVIMDSSQSDSGQWEYVAASATNQTLGNTAAIGDYLKRVVIVPETTAAGTVSIKDGSGSSLNIFVSGTLSDLHPISIELGIVSASVGGWTMTTGTNVHCFAIGTFT